MGVACASPYNCFYTAFKGEVSVKVTLTNYTALKICLLHNFEMAEITIHACLGNAGKSGDFN